MEQEALKCKFCAEVCVHYLYVMVCCMGMQPLDPNYTTLQMYNLKLGVSLHKNYVATLYIAL